MENYTFNLGFKAIQTRTNKKAFNLYMEYLNANISSVVNAYKTGCSNLKIQAENDIKKRMLDENGYNYKVLSANTYGFKCGYMQTIKGMFEVLTIDTKDNTYRILINGNYEK